MVVLALILLPQLVAQILRHSEVFERKTVSVQRTGTLRKAMVSSVGFFVVIGGLQEWLVGWFHENSLSRNGCWLGVALWLRKPPSDKKLGFLSVGGAALRLLSSIEPGWASARFAGTWCHNYDIYIYTLTTPTHRPALHVLSVTISGTSTWRHLPHTRPM